MPFHPGWDALSKAVKDSAFLYKFLWVWFQPKLCFHLLSFIRTLITVIEEQSVSNSWEKGEGLLFPSRVVLLNQTAHTPRTEVAVKALLQECKKLEYRFPPASIGLVGWGERVTSLVPPHPLAVTAVLRASRAELLWPRNKHCADQVPASRFKPAEFSLHQHYLWHTSPRADSWEADREMLRCNLRIWGVVVL